MSTKLKKKEEKKNANNNFARLLQRSQDNTIIFDFLFLFLFSVSFMKN